IALFGIAWLANTFVAANNQLIVDSLGAVVSGSSAFIGALLFARRGDFGAVRRVRPRSAARRSERVRSWASFSSSPCKCGTSGSRPRPQCGPEWVGFS
ncbi:anaerobic C4-dicarboxylate transporter family protein, partial [Agromyces humi]|uniref:anaerobic C4-dicarboxylate transporter family protein n=1 Tax=Agromyces humi TaxID=1766800 RepID=UPI001F3E88EA